MFLLLLPILAIVCFLALVGISIFVWRFLRHSSHTKNARVLVTLGSVVVAVPLLVCMLWAARTHLFWSAWARAQKEETERRQRLILYQTDHRAVLDAGRQMLADTNTFPRYPDNADLPKILRDLEPGYVWIPDDRSYAGIEMGGGFFHFGYTICRDDTGGDGEKQLLPGLWYYSEDRKVIPPK